MKKRIEDKTEVPAQSPSHILVYGITDFIGGRETYFMELFRNRPDIRFDFLCDLPDIVFKDVLKARGSEIHFIKAKGRHPLRHFFEVRRILAQHPEYTALYMNVMDAASAYTAIPAFMMGRRVIVHSHNNDCPYPLVHRICRPVLNAIASGRAACSRSAAEFMFGKKASEALTVPDFINARKFEYNEKIREEIRRELRLGDALTVCHVGRITRQKNPMFLLDIFEEICRMRNDAILLHIGTGEMKEAFEGRVREKKLDERVIMLGERADVAKLLQAGDVFLFPSVFEGFGIALLEAQAAGLPCVISDVIPKEAVITDPVLSLSLDEPAADWAEAVLKVSKTPRRDNYEDIVASGFDIGCSDDVYDRLLKMML